MEFAIVVIALALFFDFSNGFHDAANVVATMITTRALSPRKALVLASICEFIGPFLFGTAVAQMIGKNIIDISTFHPGTLDLSLLVIIAALIGGIVWNLLTWFFGLPSSSSHALIGGMVGAVLVAYGPDKILWGGLFYVVGSLVLSPLLGLLVGWLFLQITLYLSRDATPKINYFFNRMQIPSSIALALSHGANDAQKSMGLIAMSLVILGFSPSFYVPCVGGGQLCCSDCSRDSQRRMENYQDHGLKNLSLEVCSCLLCSNFLSHGDFRSCLGRRSCIHDTRRFFQHHGCWGRAKDLSRPLGSGEEYHPGLVYYYPSLSRDSGVEFLFDSDSSLLPRKEIGEKR